MGLTMDAALDWADLLTTALSWASLNTRGRGFPICGCGVTLPISTKPKPILNRPGMASACLSNPAAIPMGLENSRFQSLVRYTCASTQEDVVDIIFWKPASDSV